jgi:signal transduction histidine kinase
MQVINPETSKANRHEWLLHLTFTLLALIIPILVGYEIVAQFRTPAVDFSIDWQAGTFQDVPITSSANYSGFWPGDVILAVNGVPYSKWSNFSLGVSMLDIQRGDQRLTLELPIFPLVKYNRPYLVSAVIVALTYWILSIWLLIRRFYRNEIRIIFLAGQAIAVSLLAPMANLNARLAYWPIHLSVASLYLSAPLILHHYLTFPVSLGTSHQRRWIMAPLYALAVIAIAGWLSGNYLGRQLGTLYTILVTIAAITVMGYVYIHRARPDERRRLRLIVIGTLLAGIPAVFFYLLPDFLRLPHRLPLWLVGLFTVIAPVSYVLAIVHHNLFDIDRFLNRTVVYAILSLGIMLLYLGPFLLIYRLLQGDPLAEILTVAGLTLLVCLGFDWTHTRVRRLVDRIFYGGWYDYPGVVERISDALARCIERGQLEDVLTRQVPMLMQLKEGALWIGEPGKFHHQKAASPQLQFPLEFQDQVRGLWIVEPRRDGEDFSDSDRRILNTLARQAETSLGNVLLVERLRRQLDEIRSSREALAQAQHELLRSREEERARLARDLHDGPIQILVGLNLQLGLLASSPSPLTPLPMGEGRKVREVLQEIRAEVHDLLSDLRQVCADLRPPMLDTLGLGASLRALAEDWSAQNEVEIHLDLPPDASLRPLPGEVAVNLYRVVQEALANVARHAAARQVTITLAWKAGGLILTIQDDGRGFALPDTLHKLVSQGHFGLMGMQERVGLIGGELVVISEPGQGTTVKVTWRNCTD